VILISPHLDDGVFSCFEMLRQGATLVTICAGIPSEDTPPSQFDQRAGFTSAADAMHARRLEDLAAAEVVGFKAIHLDYLDTSYGGNDLAGGVEEAFALASRRETIYGPLGLRHPDHQTIASAFRSQSRKHYGEAWVYEELPYAYVWPEYLGPALKLTDVGPTVTRVCHESKREAVDAYVSQTKGAHMDAILAPERCHMLI
jgi:LmbE family N-acetylglucosaminyl deacetylase